MLKTKLQNILKVKKKSEIDLPPRYKVILYNDDFTTKDFVVYVLVVIFDKGQAEAEILMETVHQTGSAVIGIYSYDIAESLKLMTTAIARENEFPLKCEIEKDE